jgi:hypothetical protein
MDLLREVQPRDVYRLLQHTHKPSKLDFIASKPDADLLGNAAPFA